MFCILFHSKDEKGDDTGTEKRVLAMFFGGVFVALLLTLCQHGDASLSIPTSKIGVDGAGVPCDASVS